jgi:hypothetical protein
MPSPVDALSNAPDLFPHALDVRNDAVKFVRLDRADYTRASFLDERILSPRMLTADVPWPQTAAAIGAAGLTERCGYLFHIGHVGSTLVSRLLGLHPQVLSLREPLILRTFAQVRATAADAAPAWSDADFEARLAGCLKLLSRTYHPTQLAITKTTSFVSEMAAELLARPSAPKAAMMFVSPESYIATIFGGPNSRREATILTPGRVKRLNRRLNRDVWSAASLSEGEALALGWACEMAGLTKASQDAPGRVLAIDFDSFLARPHAALLATLRHFDVPATPAEVNAILAGPDMQRYSKGPEHAYDTALRMEVLDEARALHGKEIHRGLAWLERAAAAHPLVSDAVAFAAKTAS